MRSTARMPDLLRDSLLEFQTPPPLVVLLRLAVALALGGVVALVYRTTTRPPQDVASSFASTLVLLCILIAMVTQVIGDNVARAFSLVGALSIVRFRTVVRDTQDTAFVIFAVAVGMAVGAGSPWLAVGGIVVVTLASFLMNRTASTSAASAGGDPFELQVRVGIGHDPQHLVGPTLDQHVRERRLMSVATSRQGLAVDAIYRTELRADISADALLRALNRLDGVQSVSLQRITPETPVAGAL
jgi:uncharacterized membrane protein YhiD involved in acid resistance